jgi:hypothetical protein
MNSSVQIHISFSLGAELYIFLTCVLLVKSVWKHDVSAWKKQILYYHRIRIRLEQQIELSPNLNK